MGIDTDLRIPMTAEQKRLIDEATTDEPNGKAAWARAVLLDAARRKLAKKVMTGDLDVAAPMRFTFFYIVVRLRRAACARWVTLDDLASARSAVDTNIG